MFEIHWETFAFWSEITALHPPSRFWVFEKISNSPAYYFLIFSEKNLKKNHVFYVRKILTEIYSVIFERRW